MRDCLGQGAFHKAMVGGSVPCPMQKVKLITQEKSEVSIQKKLFQTGHPILSMEMEMRELIEESQKTLSEPNKLEVIVENKHLKQALIQILDMLKFCPILFVMRTS